MTTETTVKRVIPTGGTDTNAIYVDVKVFLEGVEVPHTSCSVSYGIDSPPTCTIIIPANAFLRSLPETTHIIIIFKDLIPDPTTGEHEWRILFDGELSGFSYSISPNGAEMTISGIHTTAYLTLMQLLNQSATEYIYNRAPVMVGDFLTLTIAGQNKASITFVQKLLETYAATSNSKDSSPKIKSMSELVFLMLRNLLEGYKDKGGPSAGWYWTKLGPGIGAYKILDRVYGISNEVKALPVMETEFGAGDNFKPLNSDNTSAGKYLDLSGEERKDLNTFSESLKTTDKELCAQVAAGIIETRIEGGYDSINPNDQDGYISIGISSWHERRASQLLSLIAETNPNAKPFEKAVTFADIQNNGGEEKLRAVLNSKEGQAAQRKLLTEDVAYYVHRAKEIGITNPQCIVYAAMWMPCGPKPDGTSNWDVGDFILARKHKCNINDLNSLYGIFLTEFNSQNIKGAADDYKNRPGDTLNYVQANVSSKTPTKTNKETSTPTADSKFKGSYEPNIENTQRN